MSVDTTEWKVRGRSGGVAHDDHSSNGVRRRHATSVAIDLEAGDRELLSFLTIAIERTFGTHKVAADALGVDKTRLSKWLNGVERFPVVVLARHGALFREFAAVYGEHRHVQVRVPDKWDRLWLITAKAVRVVASKYEEQIKRDMGLTA